MAFHSVFPSVLINLVLIEEIGWEFDDIHTIVVSSLSLPGRSIKCRQNDINGLKPILS